MPDMHGDDTPEPSMIECIEAMQADARAQEGLPALVGRVLDRTVHNNDRRAMDKAALPAHASDPAIMDNGNESLPFDSLEPCPLCPSQYVARILKYTRCSPCNLIVGIIYLQRLRNRSSERLLLTSFNMQRLFLTAMMLAHKYLDEPTVSNRQWSLIGELSVKEMNSHELRMLWDLKFSLGVSRAEYDECRAAVESLDPARKVQPETLLAGAEIAVRSPSLTTVKRIRRNSVSAG